MPMPLPENWRANVFLNPIWSLLLLCIPAAIYWFIIRPRLRVGLTEVYAGIDSFWGRVWARIKAFRTFWIAVGGAILAAAPDILANIAPIDFSHVLPQPWGGWVAFAVSVLIPLMKAFETKPGEQK